jgi:hypothetical protein
MNPTQKDTNRLIRRQYNSVTNDTCPQKWLGKYLFGVKGLFHLSGKCDFSLITPSVVVDTAASHSTWLDAFIASSAADIAKLQGCTEETIQELFDTHPDGSPVEMFSDGSMKGLLGTYAFNIMHRGLHDTDPTFLSTLHGGGKEDYSQIIEQCLSTITSFRISSTRMEALALLALHISLQYIDPKHELTYRLGCDSTAAIFTYQKLLQMNRMQFPQLPNSDVWRLIKLYKLTWGKIPIYHVPSHMDDHVSDPAYLLPEWVGNIMADTGAEDRYHEDEEIIDTNSLTRGMVGITYHNNNVVVVPFKTWARKHVALLQIKDYFNTHNTQPDDQREYCG